MYALNDTELGLPCVGADDKLHVYLPLEDKTKCGIDIRNKNVTLKDILSKFSCHICSYCTTT